MTTEDLIRCLTADRQVDRKTSVYLFLSLSFGIAVVALIFFSEIGFRKDIDEAVRTMRFPFKFIVVSLLAIFSNLALFRGAAPIFSLGPWARMLPVPALLLGAGVLAELMAVPRSEWMTRLIGSNSANCMTVIPLLGSGPLLIFIFALRRGAPANPGLAGAMAGLAASSIAAIFYATNCFDDSPLFVITWYPLAIGTVVLAGYLAGLRYLRW
jgi:hypothetical protein